MNSKSSRRFIIGTIVVFILLIVVVIFVSIFLDNRKSKVSMQIELNSIRECLKSDTISTKENLELLKNIENKVVVSKFDSLKKEQIIETIALLKKSIIGNNAKTTFQILSKLEEKINHLNIEEDDSTLEWLQTIFNWPLLVIYLIIVLIYFNFNFNSLKNIFGKVKSLNILGNEISFSEEVKQNTELSISLYRQNIKHIFDFQVQKEQLSDKLRYLVEDIFSYLVVKKQSIREGCFRCTIHVQDILFSETLYQLLDYYPRTSNGGAGRIKSMRFGIVGLAWRTEKTKIKGKIENNKEVLIRDWGLDITETSFDNKTKSFAAIMLKSQEGTRLGVLFLDSEELNLFGDIDSNKDEAEEFEKFVLDKSQSRRIIESLINMRNNLSDRFLQIHIYE